MAWKKLRLKSIQSIPYAYEATFTIRKALEHLSKDWMVLSLQSICGNCFQLDRNMGLCPFLWFV